MTTKSVLCATAIVLMLAAYTAAVSEYHCDSNTYIRSDVTIQRCQQVAEVFAGQNKGCCSNNRNGRRAMWSMEADGGIPRGMAADNCPYCFGEVHRRRLLLKF